MAGCPKRRAKTGGRKPGVSNKRKNAQELLEYIKKELRSRHLLAWPEDWDPVARMAVLAEKHFDSDPYLALSALKEITKFIRPALQSIQVQLDDDKDPEKIDYAAIARRYDELIRRPGGDTVGESFLVDEAGRRLCRSPSDEWVPQTLIDEHGAKFHQDASGQWRPEHEFSTRRAIEYRPEVIEVEEYKEDLDLDLVPDTIEVVEAQ